MNFERHDTASLQILLGYLSKVLQKFKIKLNELFEIAIVSLNLMTRKIRKQFGKQAIDFINTLAACFAIT